MAQRHSSSLSNFFLLLPLILHRLTFGQVHHRHRLKYDNPNGLPLPLGIKYVRLNCIAGFASSHFIAVQESSQQYRSIIAMFFTCLSIELT